jgi:hypothetical protein
LKLILAKVDLDNIKLDAGLAISAATTYIVVTADVATDMNENAVVPVPATDAVMVQTFTPDTTNPYLVWFDLDMNTGHVDMLFSETLNLSSFELDGSFIFAVNLSESDEVSEGSGDVDNAVVVVQLQSIIWDTHIKP